MNEFSRHPFEIAFDSLLFLRQHSQAYPDDVTAKFVQYCAANFMHCNSQLLQDAFVVFFLAGKRNGFFVEFGATNGQDLSNTLILERNFQWNGILAEPAKCWHAALRSNRKASIDTRCVWSVTGATMEFKETEHPEYSTLLDFVDKDNHSPKRAGGISYSVETISLNDLLEQHNSPKEIDYLSIDTEGSELAILGKFDFEKYDVKIITVEHNYCEQERHQIHDLLEAKGFIRLFAPLSKFDDWYIKRSIVGL